jgi:hypothetical protein
MAKAKQAHTTLSILDVIAPRRQRFNVINGGRKPKSKTLELIDRLAADLAATGPVFPTRQPAPQNPYANHYGKILDPEKAAQWDMAQLKGGAL